MSTIIFRNVHLRYADLRKKEESAPFARLHLSADLSTPIQEEMGWNIGEGVDSGKLDGLLTGNGMTFTPNDTRLSGFERFLECSEVSDFAFVTLRDNNGNETGKELRFIARSVQAGAIAIVEDYWRSLGDADSQFRVSYFAQAVQQKLPMETDDSTPAEAPIVQQQPLLEGGMTLQHATKKCTAKITVGEAPDGYRAEWSALLEFRHPRNGCGSTAVMKSEREAIATASFAMHQWASDIYEQPGSTAKEKEADALMGWCASVSQHGRAPKAAESKAVLQ